MIPYLSSQALTLFVYNFADKLALTVPLMTIDLLREFLGENHVFHVLRLLAPVTSLSIMTCMKIIIKIL